MCYDIAFTISLEKMSDYFPELIYDSQFNINFDQAVHIMAHSYGEHPVIYRHREDGQLHCDLFEWGCIPYYVKDESSFAKQRASMLNARSERILDDPNSYWYKIRERRCLVPLSGFYEHREVKGIKNKIPYFIRLKSQALFFIPGLYSVAELMDKETGELRKRKTFTILTRAANSVMQQIHNGGSNPNRMPLMLPFELSQKWLSNELSAEEYRAILHYEMPSAELDYRTVYTIRSPKPRPDDKAKDEEWVWEGVPVVEV